MSMTYSEGERMRLRATEPADAAFFFELLLFGLLAENF